MSRTDMLIYTSFHSVHCDVFVNWRKVKKDHKVIYRTQIYNIFKGVGTYTKQIIGTPCILGEVGANQLRIYADRNLILLKSLMLDFSNYSITVFDLKA